MKKWCLCILMFGMLCMLAGCEQEEETREKSISKEDFGIKSTMSNEEKAAAALAMLGIDETSSASESNKAENQEAEKEEKEMWLQYVCQILQKQRLLSLLVIKLVQ